MKHKYFALLSILLLCSPFAKAQTPGDIVITEIMANPTAVADASGEWFEIYNTTPSPIDINGWYIKDNGTDSAFINTGGTLIINAGDYLVLSNNANSATNGNINPDYEYSNFSLTNISDEIILVNNVGVTMDSVAYTTTTAGKSWSLNPDHINILDNDNFAYWCIGTEQYGTGNDLGTPALENNACSLTAITPLKPNGKFFVSNADDKLQVHISSAAEKQNWAIADITGRTILGGTLSENTENTSLSINGIKAGVYVFYLKESGLQSKFVVK